MKKLLRRVAASTEPRPGVEARLRAALDPPSAGPLLRALGDVPGGDAALVARLRARVRPPRPAPPTRALVAGGALLLVGAVAVGQRLVGAEEPGAAEAAGVPDAAEAAGAAGEPGVGTPGSAAKAPKVATTATRAGEGLLGALTTAPAPASIPPVPGLGALRPVTGPSTAPLSTGPSATARAAGVAGSTRAPAVATAAASLPATPPTSSALTAPGPAAAPTVAAPLALPPAEPRLDPPTPFTREGRRAVLRWEVGTLHAGLDATDDTTLLLRTREGEVELSRGEVALRRDRLGTRLEVVEGAATLRCEGAAPRRLGPGQAADCLPTRALGWLGRAEALREADAPVSEVLAALRAGQAVADEAALSELIAMEVDVLREAGRPAEARAAAARYPADGPRAAELRR